MWIPVLVAAIAIGRTAARVHQAPPARRQRQKTAPATEVADLPRDGNPLNEREQVIWDDITARMEERDEYRAAAAQVARRSSLTVENFFKLATPVARWTWRNRSAVVQVLEQMLTRRNPNGLVTVVLTETRAAGLWGPRSGFA